jgi:hypothetical protein
MSTTLVNFIDDLPVIRDYIADRVRTQSRVAGPISAIEVGFQLCQAGLVLLHFDAREKHDRDGTWTLALSGPTLVFPHWQAAYESAGEDGASFVLLTGERHDIDAGADDETVAGVFGEALLAITLDAIASGMFELLELRDDCQLDLEEFDGMWAWPSDYEDVGRTNIIRNLTAPRLPRSA